MFSGKGQWIDIDSVPWLISYVSTQRENTGCPSSWGVDDSAVADMEMPIPGVSITWDWQSEVWVASFSDAVRKQHKQLPQEIRSCPHDINEAKWKQGAYLHGFTVDFSASDPTQRREATRAFLIDFIKTRLK